jgi:hypothetical protein
LWLTFVVECLATVRRRGPDGHKSGNGATRPAGFAANEGAQQLWIGLELLIGLLESVHIPIMSSKRSKRNLDPSRALARGVDDTPAAGRGDRVALPGSVDVGGWRTAAAGAALGAGNGGCSSAGRDHSGNREKRSRSIRCCSKSFAAELFRGESPCPCAGRARQALQLRGTLEPASMFGGLTKVAMSEPRRFRRRGSLPLPACCHITTSAAPLIIGRLVKTNWKRIKRFRLTLQGQGLAG